MEFWFDIIKGKEYKGVFQYLCEVSNEIYFTYNDSLMINERLFELCEQCEQVKVSKRMMNRLGDNILGFKIDIYINLFIYEHENTSQLLGNRGYGRILFCANKNDIAYIEMDDYKDIYIRTDNEKLIEMLLTL